MSQLEYLRQKLNKLIELGDTESILKISQDLDKLILKHMKASDKSKQKLA